jgi:hypothetical protein
MFTLPFGAKELLTLIVLLHFAASRRHSDSSWWAMQRSHLVRNQLQ